MTSIQFDFDQIHSLPDFYKACREKLALPSHFGNNLDALWDVLTAGVGLPLLVKFVNMSTAQQIIFKKQISLFMEAVKELDGGLLFEMHPKHAGSKDDQF